MSESRIQHEPALASQTPLDAPVIEQSIALPGEHDDAMSVFFAWERLRILLNVVLGASVLTRVSLAVVLECFPSVLLFAAAVNCCFCIRPVIENYLCWMGAPRSIARPIVLIPGITLSILLAPLFLALFFWRGHD